jgi:hypothetical protein
MTLVQRRIFPVEFFIDFATIIPRDAPRQDTTSDWTEVDIGSGLNMDELRTLLSMEFHPLVCLSCSGPFDPSVSLHGFNELLRRRPDHLRAARLPQELIESESTGPLFPFREISWQAADFAILAEWPMPLSLLHAMSLLHNVREITLDIDLLMWNLDPSDDTEMTSYGYPRVGHDQMIRSLFQCLFQEQSLVEQLAVRLSYRHQHMATEVFNRVAQGVALCTSKSLVSFTVTLHCGGAATGMDRIQSWDEMIAPSLAVNYCRNRLNPLSNGGLVPQAIKAINENILYRKTTPHAPIDLAVANASSIFYMIQNYATSDAL